MLIALLGELSDLWGRFACERSCQVYFDFDWQFLQYLLERYVLLLFFRRHLPASSLSHSLASSECLAWRLRLRRRLRLRHRQRLLRYAIVDGRQCLINSTEDRMRKRDRESSKTQRYIQPGQTTRPHWPRYCPHTHVGQVNNLNAERGLIEPEAKILKQMLTLRLWCRLCLLTGGCMALPLVGWLPAPTNGKLQPNRTVCERTMSAICNSAVEQWDLPLLVTASASVTRLPVTISLLMQNV